MFTARRFRLIALAALASLVFAQAATAAMGCATLRADTARGDVVVMPSGEPCDMMGGAPAALMLKHCAQTVDAVTGDLSSLHFLDLPAPPSLRPVTGHIEQVSLDHAHPVARILGPPRFALTQRLRL